MGRRLALPVGSIGRRLRPVAGRVLRPAGRGVAWFLGRTDLVAEQLGRRWRSRESARTRALRRRARQPLPMLFELHPEARGHVRREVGLRSIGLDEIAGTAVAGATQRSGDFTPLPAFRSTNWEYRFQAIRRAMETLTVLPPIDVLRFGGRYWIEDGHNRVAAALHAGQVEIDASVTELRALGAAATEEPASLAAMLEHGRDLRAAGSGRFTPGIADFVTEDDFETASEHRERLEAGETGAQSAPDEAVEPPMPTTRRPAEAAAPDEPATA